MITGGKIAEEIFTYLRKHGGRAHINISRFAETLGCDDPSEVSDLLSFFVNEGFITRHKSIKRIRTETVPTEYSLKEFYKVIADKEQGASV